MFQSPESSERGGQCERVGRGGGGGNGEAGGVDRDTVQGEVVLVVSSTVNLAIHYRYLCNEAFSFYLDLILRLFAQTARGTN